MSYVPSPAASAGATIGSPNDWSWITALGFLGFGDGTDGSKPRAATDAVGEGRQTDGRWSRSTPR